MELTKLSETTSTITLGWVPPADVGGYVFYANGRAASVASTNLKGGEPRNTVKFSKLNPGPPFQVAAVCRSSAGVFSLIVATYPAGGSTEIYPSLTLYPSEVSP